MVLIFTCHSAPCTSPRHFSLGRLIRCRIAPTSLSASGGFAAYHEDEDRARTVNQAAAQCNTPYVINKGPSADR